MRRKRLKKTEFFFLWMCPRILLGNHQRVCISKLLKSLYPTNHTCHQKPNPPHETVLLTIYFVRRAPEHGRLRLAQHGQGADGGQQRARLPLARPHPRLRALSLLILRVSRPSPHLLLVADNAAGRGRSSGSRCRCSGCRRRWRRNRFWADRRPRHEKRRGRRLRQGSAHFSTNAGTSFFHLFR